MKKLLVWDGDETLWQGTIIEGDVTLPDYNLALCRELYNRGVVQSVASFNLQQDVEEQLHKFGLTDYFLLPQAAFGISKSVMITTIKEQLNLSRFSDIVFVDDNPHNLAEVNHSLPDVITIAPEQLEDALDTHFSKATYTSEDRDRVRMYRANLDREQAGKAYDHDRVGFLHSLQLQAHISKPTVAQMPRVLDLVVRANQLAAAADSYTPEYISKEQDNLLVLTASDKFGNYGLSGVVLLQNNQINLLVISCRLQGKGLGSTLLGHIINMHKGSFINACWQETEYNAGIRGLYDWYDFIIEKDGAVPGRLHAVRYVHNPVQLPDWVEIT